MITQSTASITLIRHGPPTVSLRTRITGQEFCAFVKRYEAAKIRRQALPPRSVAQTMHRANLVFSSHRPRALHTTKLLQPPVPPIVDERFREIEFPVHLPLPLPLRCSALTWTALAVLLWRLGYSPGCESLNLARQRARAVAELLTAKADCAGPVVLVAHGGINRLIAKELRRLGWRGPRLPRSRHWGCTTYRC
ncbi:MAG: histidine phosphatase family protein [Leptolyngbya sp. SIO4C1]|nr:histidine phosphatase family protein [Leptolyngbya sp. SIO4C1]